MEEITQVSAGFSSVKKMNDYQGMQIDPGHLTGAIEVRYSKLSQSCCSLSCGSALGHANPQPGEVCVDLGSGRGNDVIRMAELAGEKGKAWGIDISDGMIAKARKNIEKFGIRNAEIVKADLEKLPLADGSVDLIISNCVLNHARDKEIVWKEINRILRAGGRFVVADIYSIDTVPDKFRNDPSLVAECWAGSVTRDRYLQQMKNAGFDRIEILEESTPYDKGAIQVASWTIRGVKRSEPLAADNR